MSESNHVTNRQSFRSTRWTMVLAAGGRDSPASEQALAALCEAYWFPLYLFVRRQGYQPAEAQDLTQGFFADFLQRDDLVGVRPEKGRFRSFLLASLKHFLSNERDRSRAQKRGGGRTLLRLNFADAESRCEIQPPDPITAEGVFDRQWALTLLEKVDQQMLNETADAGKDELYRRLRHHLAGEASGETYAVIAADIGISESAVKMAASRWRKRYRAVLRQEIAETVASSEEIDDEIRDLFAALRGPGR